MKTKITLLLFLLFSGLLNVIHAAKAPDFSVSDYNGNVHRLYADYLDKGKVVVLKFFFVSCPPCNAIAPSVQEAYVRWGEGKDKVQFIELSILSSDNNALVKSYAQTHKLTFPGVGGQGGSTSAVAPYQSGQFGSFRGTPSFAVIAPDGEVNYPISFSKNNQVTMDTAIAQALRRTSSGGGGGGGTGPCTRAFTFDITSSLKPEKYFLEDVINGNQSYELPSGKYDCEFALPSNIDGYTITCQKYQPVDHLNGITTADIILIQRQLLNLVKLTNIQFVVADVNQSGSLTAADMSEIRKLILGVNAQFSRIPNQYVTVHDPLEKNGFIDKSVKLIDVLNKTKSNKFGIGKYGDVSGANNFAGDVVKSRRVNQALVFYVEKQLSTTGKWQYKLYSPNTYSVLGFQFGINQINSKINIISANPKLAFNKNEHTNSTLTDNSLRIVWNSNTLKPVTIQAFDTWFTFESDQQVELSINDELDVEFIFDNEEHADQLQFLALSNSLQSKVWISRSDNIIHVQAESAITKVSLYDVSGRLINSKQTSASNWIQLRTDLHAMETGMYFIQWQTAEGLTKTEKLFISEQ